MLSRRPRALVISGRSHRSPRGTDCRAVHCCRPTRRRAGQRSSSWTMRSRAPPFPHTLGRVCSGIFVADAPEHDAGMIAIAADQHAGVFFRPVRQKAGCIRWPSCLAASSQTSHPSPRCPSCHTVRAAPALAGVVARANCIAAHILEHLDLPFKRAIVDCGAERAQIVVIADAVELGMFAVDGKSFVGVELDRADAEGSLVGIDDLAILLDGRDGDIAIGSFQAPKLWPGDEIPLCRPSSSYRGRFRRSWGRSMRPRRPDADRCGRSQKSETSRRRSCRLWYRYRHSLLNRPSRCRRRSAVSSDTFPTD